MFTTLMIPGATEEQMTWLDELQRVAVTADTLFKARQQRVLADATDDLGRLTMPTLILHSVDDRMNDFELSRTLASHIPDARLVPLESSNHIVLDDEPAWGVFVDEVSRFMAGRRPGAAPIPNALLSPRELEVLRLAGDGLDNDAIAADADPQRPHRRAAPPERLRQARPDRPQRPHGRGRPRLHARTHA